MSFRDPPRGPAAISAWAVLAGLVTISTGLRFWAAHRVPTPWIAPDELIYAELGRSLYHSGSFQILGQHVRFYSLLYPAFVGLPLSLRDVDIGYTLLKALQALAMSLTAVPVYLWGRSLMSPRWALVAAALTLTIPGLAYSGLVMTEVGFFPLAALAAWAMARALAQPTLANQALAVAGIVAASATRLQGAVLGPVFVTALAFVLVFERSPRRAIRLWPILTALVLVGAGWTAWRLSTGGPVSELFGAYRAAGEVSYNVRDSVLYARWHLADVLLMTGLIPVCAVAVLVVEAVLGRQRSEQARAYLAVASALTAWLVVEVGVFASRHVGRLAERDLLALAPVLFVGFALWLDRGAPRPRIATAAVGAAALGLVLWLPMGKLVSQAAIPDAFTLIPLWRLQVHSRGFDLQLLVDLLAAAAVLAFAVVPRHVRWLLPLAVGLGLAAISVNASRVVAAQATLTKQTTLGAERRWIDEAARGPVTYLYSGEVFWNSVWESMFWNRRVDRVYSLLTARVPSLSDVQNPPVGPFEDGRLVLADLKPVRTHYLVASAALSFRGEQVAYAFAPALVLWKIEGPLRLSTWRQDVRNGERLKTSRVVVYACTPGALRLRLLSPVRQRVVLAREDRPFRTLALRAGERWSGSLPAAPRKPAGTGLCTFTVTPQVDLTVERVEFVRRPL